MDLRLPIGSLFTIFGLLLTAFGLTSNRAIYARSLGINVNLDWGIVMLVFGLTFVGLAMRTARSGGDPK